MRDFTKRGLSSSESQRLFQRVLTIQPEQVFVDISVPGDFGQKLASLLKKGRSNEQLPVQLCLHEKEKKAHSVALFIEDWGDRIRYADSQRFCPENWRRFFKGRCRIFEDENPRQQGRGHFCVLWTAMNLMAMTAGKELLRFNTAEAAEAHVLSFAELHWKEES